jgi:hypothetical protein
LNLLFQGADRRIQGCQLPLSAITPEGEHLELALLMATALVVAVIDAATADREEHRNGEQGSVF